MRIEGQSNQVAYDPQFEVCNINDLDERIAQLSDRLAISFEKGQEIPLTFSARGLFECDALDLKVRVNQRVYVRALAENMLFSTDLVEWRSFEAFFTGTAHLSTRGSNAGVAAQLELYQRV